jgi:hypothetical protein
VGGPPPNALSKLMRASLCYQNVTATVGSSKRSSSCLSKCYLAFIPSCIRISTRRMVKDITTGIDVRRGLCRQIEAHLPILFCVFDRNRLLILNRSRAPGGVLARRNSETGSSPRAAQTWSILKSLWSEPCMKDTSSPSDKRHRTSCLLILSSQPASICALSDS